MTINRWLNRRSETGESSDNYGNCGPSVNEESHLDICLAAIENPFASCAQIRKNLNQEISRSKISRVLRRNGLFGHHAATKIKQKPIHHQKRIFCVYHEDFDWNSAIFDDECCFTIKRAQESDTSEGRAARAIDRNTSILQTNPAEKQCRFGVV